MVLYQDELREKIGDDIYNSLEKEAEKEVALSLQMPLADKYYQQRFLLNELLSQCKVFEEETLKISPLEIVRILFKAKLLFASKSEEEYKRRSGGRSLFNESPFVFNWQERGVDIDEVVSEHLRRLENSVTKRTLLTEINGFNSHTSDPRVFFENLFRTLNMPFVCFFNDEKLLEEHKKLETRLQSYTLEKAKEFFRSPSIGFQKEGSRGYVYWYAATWLRTFLNMLRIAGFLFRPQIDFGRSDVEFIAPAAPVFLEDHAQGGYCWEEDTKRPWEKIPDGCLFLSFGYRGIAKMWLDERSYGQIEKLFLDNRIILDSLINPWTPQAINDIAPAIDILSSTTQTPDLGAKILQIYCCLEHLFVPKNKQRDNYKYIIGGINALRPALLNWFENNLYSTRCDYAHRGFVIRDNKTLSLVFESMKNVIALLTAKLKQS